jgi:hypothetical protein
MIAVGGLDLPDEPEKSVNERLASLERGLEHLNAGLRLLGITPCSCCANYYRSSDRGALFPCCGELVCYNCFPQWWLQQSPKLSGADRQKVERDLRRWLISHHKAEVIGRPEDMHPERLLVKLIIGCEECNGSGKTYKGSRCPRCDGRGDVWLVVRTPDML